MTATTASTPDRRRFVGALVLLLAMGLPIGAILTAGVRDVEVQPGLVDWIFVGLVAVVTVATFGLLVPWAERRHKSATVALILSGVALALVPLAFWTMAPLILGAAGAQVAATSTGADGRRGRLATAAIVVGGMAALASVAGYIATS